jgi:hypothetical protein
LPQLPRVADIATTLKAHLAIRPAPGGKGWHCPAAAIGKLAKE